MHINAIISARYNFAVWLYDRFNLSYRDIEGLLAERGITVTRESIRLWFIKFGSLYARRLKQLVRNHSGEPGKIGTDKLRSNGVAHRELMADVIHCTEQYENNRAEQSHEPTRVRERGMWRFKSEGQAQRFVSADATVQNLSNPGRHLVSANHYRHLRVSAFTAWSRAVA
jgi:putative transposase